MLRLVVLCPFFNFQRSIGLPDVHSGYGFAIGNMAAFDMNDPEAVVSPGMGIFNVMSSVHRLNYLTFSRFVQCIKAR